ncbi:hypothetical protein GGS24DRAFT_480509 [Hypoxylon argillaceum]|nr:hypothetical protein GGS24DRAFT_480509 [Hypoxylon argillaceum]
MKNVGKLVRSILGLSLLVKGAAATAPNRSVKTLFPNTTTAANSPESTEPAIPCFPFQDPDCCVDHAVCECYNGWCHPCSYLSLIDATVYHLSRHLHGH